MTTRLRGIAAATLLAAVSWAAVAQTRPAAPAASAASAPMTRPASVAQPTSTYQSAFEGYRPFAEQKVLSWRESNDLVGRIGGWQAYAREAAGEEAMPASQPTVPAGSASGVPAAPVKPAPAAKPASMPAGSTPSHGGHAMPKTP